MVRKSARNSLWFYVFLVLLGFGGICFIGYWQTYDLKCFGYAGQKTWNFKMIPPQYVCAAP